MLSNNVEDKMKNEYINLHEKYEILICELNDIKISKIDNIKENIIKSIENIELFLKLCKDKIFEIGLHAYKYDINESIRANGYRTHVKMFEKIIQIIIITLNNIKNCYNLSLQTYLDELLEYEKFLIAIYPIYCMVWTTMKINSNSLFINKNESINDILFDNSICLINEVFYGKLFGFQFNKKVRKIITIMASGMASYASGFEISKHKILQAFVALSKNGYYYVNTKNRSIRIKEIYTNPSISFLKSCMSLIESYGLQYIPAILGPNLHINRVIYIQIKELELKSNNSEEKVILFKDGILPNVQKIVDKICCRIISTSLYIGQVEFFNTIIPPLFSPLDNCDDLLIYIHGGGFVGLSSKSCEMFLRPWAVDIKIPILCIDYTLSPEAIYPQAIYECFYTYCWVLNNSTKLGTNGKKIVLIGDSAGGNLIFAITYLCIKHNVKIPYGLVGVYPSCYTVKCTSPSRTLCFNDSFISFGLLFTARNCYFGINNNNNSETNITTNTRSYKGDELYLKKMPFVHFSKIINMDKQSFPFYNSTSLQQDRDDFKLSDTSNESILFEDNDLSYEPIASPLLIEDHILKQFPPTRMILCELDPLLDEGVEFSKRLIQSSVDTNIDIIHDLPHGFLQLYNSTSETRIASDIVLSRIKELFSRSPIN